MDDELIHVVTGVGASVFFACIFLATWASSEVNWRLHRVYPKASDEVGLLSLAPLNRTMLANWTIFHLPAYILSGCYKDTDNPTVRRYGAIARFAMIVWFGGVTAFLMFLAGILAAAHM